MTEQTNNEFIENSNIDPIHPGVPIKETDIKVKKETPKELLVNDNFFAEFVDSSTDTTETVEFIPPVSVPYNIHQEKEDLYNKILGMLSITKSSYILISTDEKMPYKQDYLYKRIIGVRLVKDITIPSNYEHHGLYADGFNDITISKVKHYERVYVEIFIINPDGTGGEWKQCTSMKNIMVKHIDYLSIN